MNKLNFLFFEPVEQGFAYFKVKPEKKGEEKKSEYVYLIAPRNGKIDYTFVVNLLEQAGYIVFWFPRDGDVDAPPLQQYQQIASAVRVCDFCAVILEAPDNWNVFVELGLAFALGKRISVFSYSGIDEIDDLLGDWTDKDAGAKKISYNLA